MAKHTNTTLRIIPVDQIMVPLCAASQLKFALRGISLAQCPGENNSNDYPGGSWQFGLMKGSQSGGGDEPSFIRGDGRGGDGGAANELNVEPVHAISKRVTRVSLFNVNLLCGSASGWYCQALLTKWHRKSLSRLLLRTADKD